MQRSWAGSLQGKDVILRIVKENFAGSGALGREKDRHDLAFVDSPHGSKVLDRILEMWRAKPFARTVRAEHAANHIMPTGGKRLTVEDVRATVHRAGP